MTRMRHTLAAVLVFVLVGALMVAAHAARKLVAGDVCGGGGGGAGGGMKLVGAIPGSAAGASSGGGLKLTGGFIAAAQVWVDSTSATDAVANTSSGIVTSLATVSTANGAQITFSLSAPATVEVRVLNAAGRPVRTVTPGQECAAGLNTLTWSGTNNAGLRVPNGLYLIEVRARSVSGAQTQALATVQMAR
jgi:hypothetical protein